ncbi:MAG: chaperonin GroEL [Bradyrhizobiaceae bacterium]|nr:chaperonin GroEL [Bradyrhizobiaceae bacterium]
MSVKEVRFDSDAQRHLLRGMDLLCRAAAVTFGPHGRQVALTNENEKPEITASGVAVANAIELDDRFANIGLRLLRQLGYEVESQVGGGATTSLILAHSMVREGLKAVAAGMNPIGMKRGIEIAVHAATQALLAGSKSVDGNETMVQLASNGDDRLGRILMDALQAVGCNGLITVEESKVGSTTLQLSSGARLHRGYLSPAFITNTAKMAAELDNVVIVLHDKRISDPHPLLSILEDVARSDQSLLVVADEVEGAALATLVLNKVRGKLKAVAVKAPSTGARRLDILQDLAVITGGQVISEECGLKLETTGLEMLGRARRVVVRAHDTTIIDGAGRAEAVECRIRQLSGQLAADPTDYERGKLRQRLATLSGRAAVIKVGATTEIETKQAMQRVHKGLQAMKAAAGEGVVPGDGLSLLLAANALRSLKPKGLDESAGIDIVRRALSAPVRQIAENAGFDGGLIVSTLLGDGNSEIDLRAHGGEVRNIATAGVLDPTKTVLLALRGAGSLAALILSTGAVLAEKRGQTVGRHQHHAHCGCEHNH